MKISTIIERVNALGSLGNYTYKDLIGYLDECIDMLNIELDVNLPLVSDVYENTITYTDDENALILLDPNTFQDNNESNPYTRIPDIFIRNFVCYETIYRKKRDEDADQEEYALQYKHSKDWFNKILSTYADYTMEDNEAIVMGDDVDELESTLSTAYDNPYWLSD